MQTTLTKANKIKALLDLRDCAVINYKSNLNVLVEVSPAHRDQVKANIAQTLNHITKVNIELLKLGYTNLDCF